MGHVFISYASQNADEARALRSVLEAKGIPCWIAPDSIHGPTPWAAQIVNGIRKADMMAVVLSSDANASRHVSREVDLAVDQGLPLVVIRLEDVVPAGELEYLLRLYQWTDVFPGDVAAHEAKIVEAVTGSADAVTAEAVVPAPSAPSPSAPVATLPSPPDAFVGRKTELRETMEMLRDSRAVTLTGFGGTGKTRLSLELAARLTPEFPDGVHFIELAEIEDPHLVAQFVARSLGYSIDPEAGGDPGRELASQLAGKRSLIVLDNCEHVVDATAQLAERLLHGTDGVRILASSREPLRVRGEQEYRLGTLPAPRDRLSSTDAAAEFDAVALFVERAREANPAFALSDETVEHVTGICARIDGIPLAIELAAARIRAFTVAQIDEMLTNRLAVLTTGRRSAAPRHQTLEAAISWSYEALAADEQVTFEQLSLLRGGFDLAAARAVCESDKLSTDPALLVAGLVEKSLLLASVQSGAMRYRMMETLREYATAKLREGDGYASAAARYVGYWAARTHEAETSLLETGNPAELQTLHSDHANVRSALALAVDGGDDAAAVQLAAGLAFLWLELGLWTGGSHWLERTWSKDAAEVTTRSLRRGLLTLMEIETPADAVMAMSRRAAVEGAPRRAVLLFGAATGLAQVLDEGPNEVWEAEARNSAANLDEAAFDAAVDQGRAAIVAASSASDS